MKNVALAALVLLLGVALVGCASPRVSFDDGFAIQGDTAVGLRRVQESEAMVAEQITLLAEKVEGGEAVIAKVERDAAYLEQKDITDSEWFWLLLAAAGIPLVRPTARGAKRGVGALAKFVTAPKEPPAAS